MLQFIFLEFPIKTVLDIFVVVILSCFMRLWFVIELLLLLHQIFFTLNHLDIHFARFIDLSGVCFRPFQPKRPATPIAKVVS